jgi:hypothetical protein
VVQPATALRSLSSKGEGGAIMSEEIRRFAAGEKITVATTLGHEASGMDHTARGDRCSVTATAWIW